MKGLAPALATFAVLASAPTALADQVEVSPSDMDGWQVQVTSPDGSVSFGPGPGDPPLGEGSARLFTGTNGDQSAQLRNTEYAGTALADLGALGYSTYVVESGNGSQIPYIILSLDLNGDGGGDDLLFFEPEYQNGYTDTVPTQSDIVLGQWQTWDARAGGWWSLSHTAGAGPGTAVKTIDAYLEAQPDATIVNTASGLGGLRLVSGFAGAGEVYDAHVDAVTVGDITYDFEPWCVEDRSGSQESGPVSGLVHGMDSQLPDPLGGTVHHANCDLVASGLGL